jgi:hypothetical protein
VSVLIAFLFIAGGFLPPPLVPPPAGDSSLGLAGYFAMLALECSPPCVPHGGLTGGKLLGRELKVLPFARRRSRCKGCRIIVILPHQGVKIIFQRQVTLLVTEIIGIPGFCPVNIGEIPKVEAFIHQPALRNFRFPYRVQCLQYPSVLPKSVINTSYATGSVLVLSVVEFVPALIGTKFLVDPPRDFIATCRACSFDFHNVFV